MNDCIIWSGQISPNGYGRMSDGKRYAHREMWKEYFGDIPQGAVIKHSCDNKSCVNIEHLQLGTQSENVKEAYDRGLRKPVRKINNTQVKEIKMRLSENHSALAREFEVSRQLICDISKGRIHGAI